jgi:peptidoglycan/xylan/chitin deacetylase (PgdA/CDA1 family)
VKRVGIWVLLVIAAAAAAGRWLESRRERAVPILMYHKVGPPRDKWWVSPQQFEAHLAFLREQGYRSVLPSTLAAHRRRGRPLPLRPVVITFDDGYRNLLTHAEPLLRRYGFRAVAYLPTDYMADAAPARRVFQGVPCLTWEEVRAMRARGTIVFGGHGRSHRNLAADPDPRREAQACMRALREHGGLKPDSFCYPSGQCGEAAVRAVREAGFPAAVICGDAVARTGRAMDPYRLPRVSVMGGAASFALEGGEPGSDTCRLVYEGVPMTVWVRLRDQAHPEGGAWHGPVTLGDAADLPLPWPAPAAAATPAQALETWDRHRVLRLWRTPWRRPESGGGA